MIKTRIRAALRGVVACLAAACCLLWPPAAFATGTYTPAAWLSPAARRAVDWLAQAVPTPGVGEEFALLALLYSTDQPPQSGLTQSYVDALYRFEQSGEAADQPLASAGAQALVLAVCGEAVAGRIPALTGALADADTLLAAGIEATANVLLLHGPANVPPPGGLAPGELAVALAATQNVDGGFGISGSTVRETARTLSALVSYIGDERVAGAVAKGQDWLVQNQAAFGGFDEEGAPSARATAEVVLALAVLGREHLQADRPSPAEALLVFQNEVGAFSANLDSPADPMLSALCTLACVAYSRQMAGLPGIYELEPLAANLPGPTSESDVSVSAPASPLAVAALPTLTLPGVGVVPGEVVLGVLVLLAIFLAVICVVAARARNEEPGTLAKEPWEKKEKPQKAGQNRPGAARRQRDFLACQPEKRSAQRPAKKQKKQGKAPSAPNELAAQPAKRVYKKEP